jgi:hypothetical protein
MSPTRAITREMSPSSTAVPVGSEKMRSDSASVTGRSNPAFGKYDRYGSIRWHPG